MNKYVNTIVGLLCGGMLLVSCDSKLDVTNPNKITDDQVADLLLNGTDEEREIIIGAMVADIQDNLCLRSSVMSGGFTNITMDNEWIFAKWRDLQCGDIVYASSNYSTLRGTSWGASYYKNDPTNQYWAAEETETCFGYWYGPCMCVANANEVLQYLDDDDAIEASDLLKEYKAQCLTIRAFGYMELMERFTEAYLHGGQDGTGMPIYTTYGYNDPVAPSSATETWDFIISDLEEAVDLFHNSTLGTNGYTISTSIDDDNFYDVDCSIAQYMLARATLQTGDYSTCIAACEEVLDAYNWSFIAEENYGVNTDLMQALCDRTDEAYADDNAFLSIAVNPECMFGWDTDENVYPWFFLNTLGLSYAGYGEIFIQMDNALYDKIADDDFCKVCFTDKEYTFPYFEIQSSDTVWYNTIVPAWTNLKWGATAASGETTRRDDRENCDVVLYRTSEVLLMMAEAQASNGDESGAKSTLNELLAARTKAGATTLTCDNYPSMQGMTAMEMVKLQWRIEMWAENGCNFFNHKRWNEEPTYDGSNHWSTTSVTIEHMTWEIPDDETSTNPYW